MKKATYLLFAYSNENGEKISRDAFYQKHPGIFDSLEELALLEHDINAWCTLIMKEFFEKRIEINDYTKHFVFLEGSKTYFLFEKFHIKYIKVYFKKRDPMIYIFDMKVA